MTSTTFSPRAFEKGELILREGDPPAFAYVVQYGIVEIFRGQGAARRQLSTIHAGGIFGEMALIDQRPRMADAIAAAPTLCLLIPPDLFRDRVAKADPLIRALLRILVSNIRSMAAEMDGSAQPETRRADQNG